ncbi:hypothetical protein Taro_028651 [Colocasia esculenta]|uniref:Uncharacterized protein n=1 Tax=Colocasia esculenta TaxID=4460 RepID=A0A843VGZ9_COLES|nr:hypothetical protein [Colocasia esculenta]
MNKEGMKRISEASSDSLRIKAKSVLHRMMGTELGGSINNEVGREGQARMFASPSDLCFELDSLHDLAARGQWRAVLDKVARARSLPLLSARPPHHDLVYLAFSVLALFKLRRFRDAEHELQAALDGDLDAPSLRYESHLAAYPGRSGSMLPFAIRYLQAELPLRLAGDRAATLDRLYTLLDLVRSRARGKEDNGNGALSDQWRRREAFLVASICRHHFAHREFDVCLLLIRELLAKEPSDPALLSRLAYVQMQIGDLDGCKATFARVEELCAQRSGAEWENLVGRNRALAFVVAKDYGAAVREYETCIERDPADVVAINNKALCLMYSRDLSDSIKVLEGALERVPTAAVNETVVVNLCSMYELAYVNHGDIKRSLSNWIAREVASPRLKKHLAGGRLVGYHDMQGCKILSVEVKWLMVKHLKGVWAEIAKKAAREMQKRIIFGMQGDDDDTKPFQEANFDVQEILIYQVGWTGGQKHKAKLKHGKLTKGQLRESVLIDQSMRLAIAQGKGRGSVSSIFQCGGLLHSTPCNTAARKTKKEIHRVVDGDRKPTIGLVYAKLEIAKKIYEVSLQYAQLVLDVVKERWDRGIDK